MYAPRPTWQTHFWQMDARKVHQMSGLHVVDTVESEEFTPELAMKSRQKILQDFPYHRVVRLYVSSDTITSMLGDPFGEPNGGSSPWIPLMEVVPVEETMATGVFGRALGMELCTDRYEPSLFRYLPEGSLRMVAFHPVAQNFLSVDIHNQEEIPPPKDCLAVLKNLLEAVKERPELADSIESLVLQDAQYLVDNSPKR